MTSVVVVGEGMLELSRVRFPGACVLGYGGDALNTAIYLARRGVHVRLFTALGLDHFSDDLIAAWRDEGVDTEWVLRHRTRIPGLYAIRTRADGEREFEYWRSQSAAAALLEIEGAAQILAALPDAGYVYFTGLTLSTLGEAGQERVIRVLEQRRHAGRGSAFDPNYRPQRWRSAAEARASVDRAAACVSLVLTGMDDERALRGAASAAECVEHYAALGVVEVVVKDGPRGSTVFRHGVVAHVAPEAVVTALDSTGAGDAYNAGYLGAMLSGASATAAAAAGQRLAEVVIRHPGAIAPRSATDAMTRG